MTQSPPQTHIPAVQFVRQLNGSRRLPFPTYGSPERAAGTYLLLIPVHVTLTRQTIRGEEVHLQVRECGATSDTSTGEVTPHAP